VKGVSMGWWWVGKQWGRAARTLHSPVVDQADLVGEGEGYEVGDAEEGEDDGEEAQGRGGRFEGAGVWLWWVVVSCCRY
jgi:hypothetical protein